VAGTDGYAGAHQVDQAGLSPLQRGAVPAVAPCGRCAV